MRLHPRRSFQPRHQARLDLEISAFQPQNANSRYFYSAAYGSAYSLKTAFPMHASVPERITSARLVEHRLKGIGGDLGRRNAGLAIFVGDVASVPERTTIGSRTSFHRFPNDVSERSIDPRMSILKATTPRFRSNTDAIGSRTILPSGF